MLKQTFPIDKLIAVSKDHALVILSYLIETPQRRLRAIEAVCQSRPKRRLNGSLQPVDNGQQRSVNGQGRRQLTKNCVTSGLNSTVRKKSQMILRKDLFDLINKANVQ